MLSFSGLLRKTSQKLISLMKAWFWILISCLVWNAHTFFAVVQIPPTLLIQGRKPRTESKIPKRFVTSGLFQKARVFWDIAPFWLLGLLIEFLSCPHLVSESYYSSIYLLPTGSQWGSLRLGLYSLADTYGQL